MHLGPYHCRCPSVTWLHSKICRYLPRRQVPAKPDLLCPAAPISGYAGTCCCPTTLYSAIVQLTAKSPSPLFSTLLTPREMQDTTPIVDPEVSSSSSIRAIRSPLPSENSKLANRTVARLAENTSANASRLSSTITNITPALSILAVEQAIPTLMHTTSTWRFPAE